MTSRYVFRSTTQSFNRCCNPLNKSNHYVTNNLRRVSANILESLCNLTKDDLICDTCRKKVTATIKQDENGNSDIPMDIDNIGQSGHCYEETDFYNNKCDMLGDYLNNFQTDDLRTALPDEIIKHSATLLYNIANYFNSDSCTKTHKHQILSLFPSSMSAREIKDYLKTSDYCINQVRKMLPQEGILGIPQPKKGKALPQHVIDYVENFYIRDDISSVRPGTKDIIRIKSKDGTKVEYNKRLLLWNLLEAHELLKEDIQDCSLTFKIGLTKFSLIRPKYVLLAGEFGTHNVCVCAIHQNFKFLLIGCHIKALTSSEEIKIESYRHLFIIIICANPSEDCYFFECDKCPGLSCLKTYLTEIFEKNEIADVTFKQWVTDPSNKTTLETLVKDSDDFIDFLVSKVETLLPHAFVADQQAKYSKDLAVTLEDGVFQCIVDFAENYAFVVQDAIPGFHWNNDQATIYNIVSYYCVNGKVEHFSMVIVSDNRKHDAVAVYTFQEILIEYLKQKFPQVKKVIYFSDGAPQQFKNYKNVQNLMYHREDYEIDAEWHFYPTAHGKGPCDGLGASVKKGAMKYSLQCPVENQIINCEDLFHWLSTTERFQKIVFRYSPVKDYDRNLRRLDSRFKNNKRIAHLQAKHCLIPLENGFVRVKKYSNSASYIDQQIL